MRRPNGGRQPEVSDAARELVGHFRENYPILLDGALPSATDRGVILRQARESLLRGRVDPGALPREMLREALENLTSTPRPATSAGITAIGPRHARIWWDRALVDDLSDIIATLDKPRLVLRFYDVTGLGPHAGRWHDSFDIDVALEQSGRTQEFWASGRAYVVELGCLHSDGRFLCLARTNSADLPRDGQAEPAIVEMVHSNLRPRRAETDRILVPDAPAREWAAARPDGALRDLEAEYLIHMIYRAFLQEGPRALRRTRRPLRRDPETLRREYAQRELSRKRTNATRRGKKAKAATPTVIAARLDATRACGADDAAFLPAVFVPAAVCRYAGNGTALTRDGALILAAIAHAGAGRCFVPFTERDAGSAAAASVGIGELVRPISGDADMSTISMAAPVFEAARRLHERLSGLSPAETPKARPVSPAASKRDLSRNRVFGGAEARRFAKAGVRFTRMAVTLEGRMRPGARLKVAGKLVHADADGRFNLECVLSGSKTAISVRAGTSVCGEARSRIAVNWESRGVRTNPAACD